MVTTLSYLIANDRELLPHIESTAIKLMRRNYVLPGRVLTLNDMNGWNIRKVSEYVQTRRAVELAESTAIPATEIMRARLNSIEPKEVGDAYEVSERRINTDYAGIVVEIASALARSVGERIEVDLFATLNDAFVNNNINNTGSDFSTEMLVAAEMMMQPHFDGATAMYHVAHPYQTLPILKNLVRITDSESGTAAMNNLARMSARTIPLLPGMSVVTGALHPRNVILQLNVQGDGGTFRLQVGDGYVEGENITAAIDYDATTATMVSDIQTALNALDMSGFYSGAGTWTVTGSDETDLTITPPSDLFLDDFSQLRIANKYDSDAVINHYFDVITQKSAYDLVTTPDTGVTDMNGVEVGVVLKERSATARVYSYFEDAIVRDVRKPITPFSDLEIHDGRTNRYALSTTYGTGSWRPYRGMYTITDANSPRAVG